MLLLCSKFMCFRFFMTAYDCLWLCVYIYTYMHIIIYIHTYVCIYIYIYTYTFAPRNECVFHPTSMLNWPFLRFQASPIPASFFFLVAWGWDFHGSLVVLICCMGCLIYVPFTQTTTHLMVLYGSSNLLHPFLYDAINHSLWSSPCADVDLCYVQQSLQK